MAVLFDLFKVNLMDENRWGLKNSERNMTTPAYSVERLYMKLSFKKSGISVLLLGSLFLLFLAGCRHERDNREWIEKRVSEVGRVYPTENLFDLFKEFPDGFTISQGYRYGDYLVKMILDGDSDHQTISGTLRKIDVSSREGEELASLTVDYKDGQFIFSDSAKAKEIWPFDGFLFQKTTINASTLSELTMVKKSYNFQNGDFEINYIAEDDVLQNYIPTNKNKDITLQLGGSNSNRGYYYSVVLDYEDGSSLIEIVSD